MDIRLARELESDSIVDGEGIRTVIWTQGCTHNCPFCHNPETHDLNGGFSISVEKLKQEIDNLEGQDGITFSGGDPMCQITPVLNLAKYIKSKDFNIWCYTGYTFEELLKRSSKEEDLKELLNYIDVLVDGRFIYAKKSFDTIFRGSTNQRIIDVKKSLELNKAVEVQKYKNINSKKEKRETYI